MINGPQRIRTHATDEKTKAKNKNAHFASVLTSVITSWLERIDGIKTFDEDPLVLEQDIVDIRQLLEESDKPEENAEC